MSDLRMVPGIGAKKEQELMELGYGSLEALKKGDTEGKPELKQAYELGKSIS